MNIELIDENRAIIDGRAFVPEVVVDADGWEELGSPSTFDRLYDYQYISRGYTEWRDSGNDDEEGLSPGVKYRRRLKPQPEQTETTRAKAESHLPEGFEMVASGSKYDPALTYRFWYIGSERWSREENERISMCPDLEWCSKPKPFQGWQGAGVYTHRYKGDLSAIFHNPQFDMVTVRLESGNVECFYVDDFTALVRLFDGEELLRVCNGEGENET